MATILDRIALDPGCTINKIYMVPIFMLLTI